MIKHRDQTIGRGKGLLSLNTLILAHHQGKSGQETEGRNWSRNHRGILLTDFLLISFLVCFITQNTSAWSEVAPFIMSLPFHINHQSRKFSHRLAHRRSDGGIFFQLRLLFPDDSGLCQVEKKISNQGIYHYCMVSSVMWSYYQAAESKL